MHRSPSAPGETRSRRWIWLGVVLLVVGFFGHWLAARAIGGSYVAYRDHMIGFVGVALLSGALIVGLGRLFWRGRHDITLLILGAVQALFGIVIYIERFHLHG